MMKKIVMIGAILLTAVVGTAQKKSDYEALSKEHEQLKQQMKALQEKNENLMIMYKSGIDNENQVDMVSYAYGYTIGENLRNQGMEVLSYQALSKGLSEAFEGKEGMLSAQEMQKVINDYMTELAAQRAAKAKEAGIAFLKTNAERKEVKVTESGLQYEVVKEGSGEHPAATSKVTVHYEGTTIDGKIFDSSKQRNQPATFGLNQVIKGWTEGVQLMTPGSIYKFYIPSDLAYGDRGAGNSIGPGETLIFEVELISIN